MVDTGAVAFRSALRLFAANELRSRFQGNVSGIGWAFLAPLLQLAIFHFVFTHIFRARVPGLEGVGYLAFLALGFWPWFAFSEAVVRASGALHENAALIGKVALPRMALVLSKVLAAFAIHGAGYLAVLLALAVSGAPLQWGGLPVALLLWLPLLVLAAGMSLLAASTQVFVRDLAQALGPLLSLWFFLTPIIYSREMVPERFRAAFDLNPLTGLIEAMRSALLGSELPWPGLAVSAAGIVILCALGSWVFRRCDRYFEEFL